jgi:hypothetical protein
MPVNIRIGQLPEASEESVTKYERESEEHFRELQQIESFQRLINHPDWPRYVEFVAAEIKQLNLSLQNIDPYEKPKDILRVQARIKALGMLVEEPVKRASSVLWEKTSKQVRLAKAKAERLLAKLTTS